MAVASAPLDTRKKLALATLTADDRLAFDTHDCELKKSGACLRDDGGSAVGRSGAAVTWANVACVRALVRDKRLTEGGLTRVLTTVLTGHTVGTRDYNVLGRACCLTAFMWCFSISASKYNTILASLPPAAAAQSTAPLGKNK